MSDFFEEQFGTATLAMAPAAKKAPPPSGKDDEGQLTVDVYQTDDEIVIKSTIAGVTVDDIDISITNDMITIKGKRNPDEHIDQSDYYYQELYWGQFARSIILPEDIDVEKAAASMKNGILTIRLPKLAKSRMKKVKISS
ncbi:MAG: Hsp20/alpha crystallin family protein [Patescibacteria group bacterium]